MVGARVEKNISATNPITCGRVNPDIFLPDDVTSVSTLTEQETNMAAQRGGRTEQISRHYLAVRCMLWRHFSAEESWVLEWIRIPSDTCGRANSIWIRYVWTEKFLYPERKSWGLKNIRIRVDGALVVWMLYLHNCRYVNNSLNLTQKYAQIFVHGHFCSEKRAVSFPRA